MKVETNSETNCEKALSGLHTVEDPEICLNVVDLGLIRKLEFRDAEKEIHCTMTLTTQFCPMGESLVHAVMENLLATFPGYTAHVNLSFEPPWNPAMISDAGREFLKS